MIDIEKERNVKEKDQKEADNLPETLEGYKEKIATENKGSLTWERELIFHGRTQRGEEIDFDGQVQWGCMPTEALIMSLAACLAIDVVAFLSKMKAEISFFKIEYSGERNPVPPQYYKSVGLKITVGGSNITPKKMDRVISLSQDKYCSVRHSLRQDLDVKIHYEIQ